MSWASRSTEREAEATEAAWESAYGAFSGGLKWGLGAGILAAVGMKMSPVYRGLTLQFKVYIQMSAMVLGGMIEADARLRMYEARMRQMRRQEAEAQKWNRLMAEIGDDD
ncbi:hypothetical protein HOO65_040127 [Ceratocystis lukuohia]|uniref:Imidazoleglycerol-phosphate dehydratase n=3 Tax=Ceratocystis TaxID=5157 RepID=A0A0F8BX76_CERFI|nr:hypothetical protein CFO_g514 [Ceratocystis platani]PHH52359.1 hypothetical protein CFIMG_004863RA [Ceratocystis fimbriata CBS 114723]